MRTTLDLPDPLMRRVKIRAASEGRKLKDLVAELIESSLSRPAINISRSVADNDKLPFDTDPVSGFPIARTLNTPGFVPLTAEESIALIQRANEEDDLQRAGLSR
jgi:plasmid stability protein